jgi:hypothetical protein
VLSAECNERRDADAPGKEETRSAVKTQGEKGGDAELQIREWY